MTIIKSKLSVQDSAYQTRFREYLGYQAQLQERLQKALAPHGPEGEQLARKRGKFLCSERIAELADRGAEQVEIAPLAGTGLFEGVPPGSGIRTVVIEVHGRKCLVVANDPLVKGGTYYPSTVKKHLRAQEIALENRLPCIYLVDSGGAFLPLQAEVFPDKEHFGRIFFNQARLSQLGIPQISAVLGSCTAGGAYVPAMSDESVIVRNQGTVFLGGPPLVKAATGIEVSAEELGGGDVHARKSGVVDHLVDSEGDALNKIRQIIKCLGPDRSERLIQHLPSEEPLYPVEELLGILGTDPSVQTPALEVIARLVDGSRFEEFKANYGETLRCGFSHLGGYLVGIIANDGILFSESALKGAHFIQLCNQRAIPLLFLQNIVGFMVGKDYEHKGIAKEGAKMVSAVATANVPKLTLITGGSYGAGNYAMCGRSFAPRYLFTWPNSRISVMGGTQASRVLTEIKFGELSESKEAADFGRGIRDKYEVEGDPYYATARLWDDGILDPVTTRASLIAALSSLHFSPKESWGQTFYRM